MFIFQIDFADKSIYANDNNIYLSHLRSCSINICLLFIYIRVCMYIVFVLRVLLNDYKYIYWSCLMFIFQIDFADKSIYANDNNIYLSHLLSFFN